MEENKDGDNGKLQEQKPEFKYFVNIRFHDETGAYAFETNVPNAILGYGMVEFAKKGIDNHILRVQQQNQKKIVSGGGIMNFARRFHK